MITKFQSDLPCGRQRFVALARHHQACVAEIRERGLPAALEYVETLGGVSQKRGLARSILRALDRDLSFGRTAYEIRDHTNRFMGVTTRQRLVWVPGITWKFHNHRQIASLETLPMFGFGGTLARAARLP